jgi:hypothetical protein
MRVPGVPFLVSVPVAHNDRPPEGEEAALFTYRPASEYDEQWVGIDLVTARKVGQGLLDGFRATRYVPWLP